MRRIGFTASTGLCFALLVLSISFIGRLPTSECPCNDLPSEETARDADCPFGKLRTLTSHLLQSTTIEITKPREQVDLIVNLPESYEIAATSEFSARAPPKQI